MRALLQKLRKEVVVGFVGGSDFQKQLEQLGSTGMYFLLVWAQWQSSGWLIFDIPTCNLDSSCRFRLLLL
jgi:hypothetical protein